MKKRKYNSNNHVSKSWFCVHNNPENHDFTGSPKEIVEAMIQAWVKDSKTRTCAIAYCISEDGLKHCHAVLEDSKSMRFSAVKKEFPAMHIEPTKGNKAQAEDYINKRPPFDEAGEKVIYVGRHGEIQGRQGKRNDLDYIDELIQQGLTPNEIMSQSLSHRKFDRIIRDAFYAKRSNETPPKRDVEVYYHVGGSGTGKTHEYIKLVEEHGEDEVYFVREYSNGFDKYCGERYLFLDEIKPNSMPFSQLLNILDSFKSQLAARYTNVIGLWTEVHITSVFSPENLHHEMVKRSRNVDSYEQLRRRIDFVIYHFISEFGEMCSFEVPIDEYTDYESLKGLVQQCEEEEYGENEVESDLSDGDGEECAI